MSISRKNMQMMCRNKFLFLVHYHLCRDIIGKYIASVIFGLKPST